jgi:hypothetical protein
MSKFTSNQLTNSHGKQRHSKLLPIVKGTVKVYPITGHEGAEGEQRYNSTLSLTLVLDGGGWSSRLDRFSPGKEPVPTV